VATNRTAPHRHPPSIWSLILGSFPDSAAGRSPAFHYAATFEKLRRPIGSVAPFYEPETDRACRVSPKGAKDRITACTPGNKFAPSLDVSSTLPVNVPSMNGAAIAARFGVAAKAASTATRMARDRNMT
jgi:hypothetical protein